MANLINNIGPWASVAGTAFDFLGQNLAGRMARIEGQRKRVEAQFAQRQAEEDATAVLASAQRDMLEERRKAEYLSSRALAVAAASGGGAADPTVARLISDIQGEGALRAAIALYEGESRARKLRIQGKTMGIEGEAARVTGLRRQQAYQIGSIGALAKGASSFYSRYGQPSGDSALIEE